ncbi:MULTISPECIES: class I SAM-dependent methyltransferase [unclassified Granulicatella]|uniref:class I SAM-dependent methyltransferase n=1 Tax=unclassified Granulicatella TaxID=2630493 RepID=UPI0010738A07|nr:MULTISPECIES: class I SAM-dependent methyltransferase [unclassified Granulicatella]MBF0781112.1 methyltransferase domain-containing protein [Granulicatella sp. 19428wC4_WM01]TFU91950.1 methyltransferase domain-containing protein [Granulicatella sp. WM01]
MANTLLPAQQYSHILLRKHVKEGDIVIDATIGNGHDTVLLAELVGTKGKVIGVDIQAQAIEHTTQRLIAHQLYDRCELVQIGHQHLDTLISNQIISTAIFNLGYLPGSNKHIITQSHHTICAMQHILKQLKQNGLLILVVYYGHVGGKEEQDDILKFVKHLPQKDYTVLNYAFLNQVNSPPHAIAIEKLRS